MNSSDLPESRDVVAILLSCFNGEEHLEAQIESLLQQQDVEVLIFIRDDGSSDKTSSVLEKYKENKKIVFVSGSSNIGISKSFYKCLDAAYSHAEWFAFCDQDDVWHPDKLRRALDILKAEAQQDAPLLYASEYNFCNSDLTFIKKSSLNKIGVSFQNSIYETPCSGNTQVFNKALAEFFLKSDPNDLAIHHDCWSNMIGAALGKVCFDDAATLEYRRTGNNVSFGEKNPISLLIHKMKLFLMQGKIIKFQIQLDNFKTNYYQYLSSDMQRVVDVFIADSRLRKVFYPSRLRQKVTDEIFLRTLFLFNIL